MGDILEFFEQMGFLNMTLQQGIMLLLSFFLLFLAIKKQYEPLLLLPIAFGMLLTNLPGAGMYHSELWTAFLDANSPAYHSYGTIMREGGLLDILYIGVKAGVYPCLIFMGVGAMTDFGPLIANPKSLLLGAAAQLGIFLTFLAANAMGFTEAQAGSIGIIGGADGPTSIFLTSKLAPELLGPIAIAAYSYMALVPVIQPPIMRALTTSHCSLLLHGSCSGYPAAYHACPDNQEGACHQDEPVASCKQDREDNIPDCHHNHRGSHPARCRSSDRLPHAG